MYQYKYPLTQTFFVYILSFSVIDVLNKTDALSEMLDDVVLETDFGSGSVARKLKMVAKLMHLNEARNVNRDVFLVHNVSALFFCRSE